MDRELLQFRRDVALACTNFSEGEMLKMGLCFRCHHPKKKDRYPYCHVCNNIIGHKVGKLATIVHHGVCHECHESRMNLLSNVSTLICQECAAANLTLFAADLRPGVEEFLSLPASERMFLPNSKRAGRGAVDKTTIQMY
jgi:hypothetical protein